MGACDERKRPFRNYNADLRVVMSVTKESLCGLNRIMFSGISVVPLTVLFKKCDIIEQEPYCTVIRL